MLISIISDNPEFGFPDLDRFLNELFPRQTFGTHTQRITWKNASDYEIRRLMPEFVPQAENCYDIMDIPFRNEIHVNFDRQKIYGVSNVMELWIVDVIWNMAQHYVKYHPDSQQTIAPGTILNTRKMHVQAKIEELEKS